MYVVAQHRLLNPEIAFQRGEKLLAGEGAPEGVRNLQFLPARDGSAVTCLWEAGSVEEIQSWVDGVLGDAAENHCYEVEVAEAFAERPEGLSAAAPAR
jgi:hypothetical protein